MFCWHSPTNGVRYQLAQQNFTPHALQQDSRASEVRKTWTWTDARWEIYLYFSENAAEMEKTVLLSDWDWRSNSWIRNGSPLGGTRGSVGKVVCLLPTQTACSRTHTCSSWSRWLKLWCYSVSRRTNRSMSQYATLKAEEICQTKLKLDYKGRRYFTTDGQYVLLSTTLVGLATRYYFLSVGCCLKFCGLVTVGRPLWREDGSAICSAITRWSELLGTRNHTSLSHLRPPQPGQSQSQSQSQSPCGWWSVSQYVLVSSPLWDFWPEFASLKED
jgi:hypothetical protein